MSKIEWTDRTWNPVTGCNKVSQGCKNCYAEVMHRRLMKLKPLKYSQPFLSGPVVHYNELDRPLKWRKSSMVFVNSMSDLFHEDVPLHFIHKVFDVMARCPQHTFQILTKRPKRMLEFVSSAAGWIGGISLLKTTLCNVWLGTSCEDQATANERIPMLLKVPAAVRFLSCEPLLGPIDLGLFKGPILEHKIESLRSGGGVTPGIHWVIAGGESGHGARPMDPAWARGLRDQCQAAGIPFFFKQWGGTAKAAAGRLLDGKHHDEFPKHVTV